MNLPRGKQSGIGFGQRNKQRGQSDIETLVNVKRYLFRKWKIRWIKIEWYLLFDKEKERIHKWTDVVTKEEATNYIVKNPDIMLWYKTCGLVIIEVDGAVHDRKVAKTVERNRLYREAGLKLIVVNLADMKERKKSIEDYLDEELSKWI
jgi:hypothetical protein